MDHFTREEELVEWEQRRGFSGSRAYFSLSAAVSPPASARAGVSSGPLHGYLCGGSDLDRASEIVDEGWRMANAVASQALRDVSRRSRCAALTGTDLHARRVLRHDRVLRGMSRSYFSQHERGNEYLVRSRLSSLLSGSPNR